MRLTIPVGSAQGALDRGIPQLRNFLTEEFLGSGVPGHPRVVRIQGWFLAGPILGPGKGHLEQKLCTTYRPNIANRSEWTQQSQSPAILQSQGEIASISCKKLNRGVSKPGGFPLSSGKVQIVSRTLSGLFLVGALNWPRKRKRTNRENPRTIPEQIRKIPEKSGKSQKKRKRTKKEGHVQIGKTPLLKPPRLAALDCSD